MTTFEDGPAKDQPDPIFKRPGQLRISRELALEHPREVLKVMANVLIIRCEHRWSFDGLLYEGYSDLFEEWQGGAEEWPHYTCDVTRVESGEISFAFRKI